jgi:hypothetical protein
VHLQPGQILDSGDIGQQASVVTQLLLQDLQLLAELATSGRIREGAGNREAMPLGVEGRDAVIEDVDRQTGEVGASKRPRSLLPQRALRRGLKGLRNPAVGAGAYAPALRAPPGNRLQENPKKGDALH